MLINREIYIVSRCLKSLDTHLGQSQYHFHFKGYLFGIKVSSIRSIHPFDQHPIVGRDYVLKGRIIGFEGRTLVVESLFLKDIEEAQEIWPY